MARIRTAHQLELELAANTRRFSEALTRGDCAGAAAVYVEEAFLLPPIGDTISSRDAIARFWRSGIEIGLRAVKLESLGLTDAGRVLVEHGRYRMLLAPAEGVSKMEAGAYIVFHVQVDGGSWFWAGNAFGGALRHLSSCSRREGRFHSRCRSRRSADRLSAPRREPAARRKRETGPIERSTGGRWRSCGQRAVLSAPPSHRSRPESRPFWPSARLAGRGDHGSTKNRTGRSQ